MIVMAMSMVNYFRLILFARVMVMMEADVLWFVMLMLLLVMVPPSCPGIENWLQMLAP